MQPFSPYDAKLKEEILYLLTPFLKIMQQYCFAGR